MIIIYKLIDPRNEIVRYVGWTSKKLKIRLSDHIYEAKRGFKNHKSNWIRKLLNLNITPRIETIEECPYENREEREKYWISYYGRNNLVNGTDGGEGVKGLVFSKEARENLSKSHIGQKPWNKGLSTDTSHLSSYQYKKGSAPSNKGIPLSKETKEKISVSKTNKHIGKKRESISKYLGITKSKKDGKWISQITHDKKRYTIGRYLKEEDAAISFDISYVYFVKDSENLNFPNLYDKYLSLLMDNDSISVKELRIKIKGFINKEDK